MPIKGWKHAQSDLKKFRAEAANALKSVHLTRVNKDGSESKMHDATTRFNSVEEAKQHHSNLKGLNPNSNIRHNLYVDGKHVEMLHEVSQHAEEEVPTGHVTDEQAEEILADRRTFNGNLV